LRDDIGQLTMNRISAHYSEVMSLPHLAGP